MTNCYVLGGILALAAWGGVAADTPDCPYLAAFKRVQKRLPNMQPKDVISGLERYRATHENPAACEDLEIDRLIASQEGKMISIAAGTARLNAQAVYNCSKYDPKTTLCTGLTTDDTAHPFSAGIQPIRMPPVNQLRINSRLPGAILVSAYTARLSDLLDGRPAVTLPVRDGNIALNPVTHGSALIVIFTANEPRHYIKAVWYF